MTISPSQSLPRAHYYGIPLAAAQAYLDGKAAEAAARAKAFARLAAAKTDSTNVSIAAFCHALGITRQTYYARVRRELNLSAKPTDVGAAGA